MLEEEVVTLMRAATFTWVRAPAFSQLQAKAFSWEETREGGAEDVVGEARGSDTAGEEGGDVQAGWGGAAAPNLQMTRAAPFDLAGAGGS
jgi:hypothetical protein